jgi:hypothetical protein
LAPVTTIASKIYDTFKKPTVLLLTFTVCFIFWFDDFLKPYNKDKNQTNFVWEVMDHYSYLPAAFLNDGSFDFKDAQEKSLPMSEEGRYYPRGTYGMAVLYLPFFGIAAVISLITGEPVNAFSVLFADCVRFGMIFYVIIGLIFLRKFLLLWFNEVVVAFTLFAVVYGSMLYFYSFTHAELHHSALFSLFCVFMYYTQKWHSEQKFKYALILALLFGLISLIQFTEIYILLFFLAWGLRTKSDLREKMVLFKKKFNQIALFPVCMLVFWLPQLLFWKAHLGSFFFDANGEEGYFWTDPQIVNILFSYRKGWLLYTPLVILAFIGFFFIPRRFSLSVYFFAGLTGLMIYVYSCWWDWGYGAGFGNRAFCQLIALLAIPIASLVDFILFSPKKIVFRGEISLVLVVAILSCACMNMGQSYQFQEQRKIHPWAMSGTAYWDVFRHYHHRTGYDEIFQTQLDFPDYSSWIKGIGRDDKKGEVLEP